MTQWAPTLRECCDNDDLHKLHIAPLLNLPQIQQLPSRREDSLLQAAAVQFDGAEGVRQIVIWGLAYVWVWSIKDYTGWRQIGFDPSPLHSFHLAHNRIVLQVLSLCRHPTVAET